MPELPEVEVVRRGLVEHVTGRIVQNAKVLHSRAVRKNVGDLAAELPGRRFGEPRRRGKYLWLPFEDGDALVIHLGMSGQVRVWPTAAPPHRHSRLILALDDADLHFVDQRMFGSVTLSGPAGAPDLIQHIALDPFDPDFQADEVAQLLATKPRAIKRMLLDQNLVSGIGNIYADEALWRAGIAGEALGSELGPQAIARVLVAAGEVMRDSLAQGGTSFDALYVNVAGESGYFERSLNVYGREGQPCFRCGTPIIRRRFMNRSSFTCPSCQPLE